MPELTEKTKLLTPSDYIKEFYLAGQVIIPDDKIFHEVADKLNIFKTHNPINISRLGCSMTRIYF